MNDDPIYDDDLPDNPTKFRPSILVSAILASAIIITELGIKLEDFQDEEMKSSVFCRSFTTFPTLQGPPAPNKHQ